MISGEDFPPQMDSKFGYSDRSASGNSLFLENLVLVLPGTKSAMAMDEASTIYSETLTQNSLKLGTKSAMEMNEPSKMRYFPSIIDEEYNDYQLPEKKRRLTIEQVNLLEMSFEEDNKLEAERKTELAKKLGLPQRQVAVWFQNRKARCKIKQIERDYNLLKACYDSLLEKHEFIITENEKLRSKVLTLTEKLLQNGTSPQSTTDQTHHKLSSKGDETPIYSTAQVPLANQDYLTSVFTVPDQQSSDESFSWWVWPNQS